MNIFTNTRLRLNSGESIPIIGLGTWTLRGSEAENVITWAIEMGYTLIDTASYYRNERIIGKSCLKLIENGTISRKNLYLTSKIWPSNFGTPNTKKAVFKSLSELGMEYLDLYLIHWPGSDRKKRIDTWKVLEHYYEEGLIKSIGVSNFNTNQLNEIIKNCKIRPAINQIRLNPFSKSDDVLEYCRENKIVIEAYSPLTQGDKLSNSIITKLAIKYEKSTAQILLRWGVQREFVIIPKSSNKNRLLENISIFDFEIDDSDMNFLNQL